MNALSIGLCAVLACAGSVASAQAIYRCGNEYTKVPCAGGKTVEADDGPASGSRAADARRVAAAERRLGDDMARERRAREAATRPATASSLGPAKAVEPARQASASMRPKKRAKGRIRVLDERDFVARVPKPAKRPAP